MKSSVSYKNCVIRGESFQLVESSSWIPRYTLMRRGANDESNGDRLYHDRLDKVFLTEKEADDFAVRDAMEWIDTGAD